MSVARHLLLWLTTGLVLAHAAPAGARPRHAKHHSKATEILWRDPGNVRSLDLVLGPGGAAQQPRPPFHFVKEDMSGTTPKVTVRDARGVNWAVKWGPEAKPSPFSSHFAWACGYIAETEYFIAQGRIEGAHHLKRARGAIKTDGSFEAARFQLRSKWPKFMKDRNWAWVNNPFIGTPEYNGLRILMMLLSNWDAKDARDLIPESGLKSADSNLAIFEERDPKRYLYFVSDWGATLGKWSAVPLMRTKWDAKGYLIQSDELVRGVKNGVVQWGYTGVHAHDVSDGIRVSDVQWLLRYLGKLTDAQIERGLRGCGATDEETAIYGKAIRQRIRALEDVARR